MNDIKEIIAIKQNQLRELELEKLSLQSEIEQLEQQVKLIKSEPIVIKQQFTTEEKIKIFMNLFRGRTDVFAKRWENSKGLKGYSPACFNEFVNGVCHKPKIKCSDCKKQAFIPYTNRVVLKHLIGEDYWGGKRDYTVGLYPMLLDETCWFLAVDFDKAEWQRDVLAFVTTCKKMDVPALIEKSRSGIGGHVWIFFEQAIPAIIARRMGAALLTHTMESFPEISFESYDRFFPNQDTLPNAGFGNLIALPLQRLPREDGNSLFINEQFEPYADQWGYLSSVTKMTPEEVNKIIADIAVQGNVLGVRMVVDESVQNPWDLLPSRVLPETIINAHLLPKSITMVLGNQIFIAKNGLPPYLINKLVRLAAFQNPEFYKAQAMRLPVFNKPRIISCAEHFSEHIGLPRGCFDECVELLKSLNIDVIIEDKRNLEKGLKLEFLGELTAEQKKASAALLKYDTGVLSATTAFGKTVVGAYMIAKRQTTTIVIVHRVQLMEQWIERLKSIFKHN